MEQTHVSESAVISSGKSVIFYNLLASKRV